MIPIGTARERFSVKFYLVAMVFILFDIEAIFLYPWAVVYRDLNRDAKAFGVPLFGFFEMFVFVVLVLAGFFYIWKKGVLDWAAEEPEPESTSALLKRGGVVLEPGPEVETVNK